MQSKISSTIRTTPLGAAALAFGIVVSIGVGSGIALAQTTTAPAGGTAPMASPSTTMTPATPMRPTPGTTAGTTMGGGAMGTTAAPMPGTATGTRPMTGAATMGTTPGGTAAGSAAAGGNGNQAIATTRANAMMPAKGHNSFTMAQARKRLESNGFTNVSGLAKDRDGIWRGKASKSGNNADVWLDYKGNAGQQ